jgi:hypothetical protein
VSVLHLKTYEEMSMKKNFVNRPLTALAGILVFVVVCYLAHWAHDSLLLPAKPLTLLIGVMGAAVGWLAGFLASPFPREREQFTKWTAAIASFLSGYILSKLEPSLAVIFDNGMLVKEPLYGLRGAVFVVTFITAAIQMYAFRSYKQEALAAAAEPADALPKGSATLNGV